MTQHTDGQTFPDPYADPARWAARLSRLLDEQRSLYESLDSLSRRQARHIEDGDADTLLSLLTERQRLIERLAKATEEFAPFRRSWPDLMRALPEDARAGFEERVRLLAELIGVIAERDEQDRRALEDRRGMIAAELGVVTRGRGAVAAYGRPGGESPPRYQDREG